jgi:hypothetical protein
MNMNCSFPPPRWRLLLIVALSLLPCAGSAQVVWRVSIKVFTDASSNRPLNRGDGNIQDDFVYYNNLLGKYARGCQFTVTEIVQMPSSLSAWFNVDPRNSANRNNLQTAAGANSALYAYRNDAINLYINNGSSGICCGNGNGLIFIGREDDHINPMHEIGHMLGLAHTQGIGCGNCTGDALGSCSTPGNDNINDTIPDLACWSRDQVAQNTYGIYANLNGGQQYSVDNVWLNIMSYHYGNFNNGLERLTPNQMDLVAETSNGARFNTATRSFIFVDSTTGNDSIFNNGRVAATSVRTIGTALSRSANNDSLQLRAGSYGPPAAGNWVLNAPRVLCSRGGSATLVRP